MSRCFPFPPPGYEKKITPEKTDNLIKEKYKENKQKKDKDKEKKEGKEKKSKDRSKHKDRKVKEKDEEESKPLEEKKPEVLSNTGHREKLVTNTIDNSSNGESKYVQDLARRIRYEEEATGSQSAQKVTNQKVITAKAFESSSFCPVQETNHRENDDKRISIQKNFAVAIGADQKRADEAMGRLIENRHKARDTESPEENRRKESATKSAKPSDKDIYKEKKTESVIKTDLIRNGRPPDISGGNIKNPVNEGNLGKRKNLETNGVSYENGTTPNKLQRHLASVENGGTLGAHRTPPIPASEIQKTSSKPKVKEATMNGFIVSGENQKVCPPDTLAATMKVKGKENGEASAKPPHPDLKYLNQILNIPKRELFLEFDDDQEWLYGPLGVKLKKARTDPPDSGESLQVWNQAFGIESADISALPYVVPF